MGNESPSRVSWWRWLLVAGVAAAGLVSIVGSGGGVSVDAPECSFFSNVCNPTFLPGTIPPLTAAFVSPQRITVQVGGPVVFSVRTAGIDSPTYQWSRSSDGGRSYSIIVGATGATYTLAGAQLVDDAAEFRVDVQGSGGSSAYAVSQLVVSSMPGIVFQDGEFLPADWVTTESASPALNGPVHTEDRATAGGNPDAFRTMVHVMPQGPSTLSVFHASSSSSYDPGSQGAIHVIDYVEDCIVQGNTSSTYAVDSNILIEQAGRRYGAVGALYCPASTWTTMPLRSSLSASDFVLIDGPACAAGESCPDFSATAKQLRFGFARHSQATAGPAGTIQHGIDNWKVTVWRR